MFADRTQCSFPTKYHFEPLGHLTLLHYRASHLPLAYQFGHPRTPPTPEHENKNPIAREPQLDHVDWRVEPQAESQGKSD